MVKLTGEILMRDLDRRRVKLIDEIEADLREIKKCADYAVKREEILEMIWNMEEDIMGRTEVEG